MLAVSEEETGRLATETGRTMMRTGPLFKMDAVAGLKLLTVMQTRAGMRAVVSGGKLVPESAAPDHWACT